MNLSSQIRTNKNSLTFDSGMELIWFLEDAYENKDMNKFLSLVCLDFKKDFKNKLEKEFNQIRQINLYFHLYSKSRDLSTGDYFYDICWSKRFKNYNSDFWQRDFGKATIVLNKSSNQNGSKFILYDICGDNPFGKFIR